jgi:hypothetical protein
MGRYTSIQNDLHEVLNKAIPSLSIKYSKYFWLTLQLGYWLKQIEDVYQKSIPSELGAAWAKLFHQKKN